MATWVARCSWRRFVISRTWISISFGAAFFGSSPDGLGEEGLGEFLCCADGELAANDLVGGELLAFRIFQGEDGFRMADGDLALGEVDLDVLVKIEQAHGVGDRGAGFADAGGDLFLF